MAAVSIPSCDSIDWMLVVRIVFDVGMDRPRRQLAPSVQGRAALPLGAVVMATVV